MADENQLESEAFTNDGGEYTGSVEFAPSTGGAILVAGIVVPGVLAVVGGLLAQWRDGLETVMASVEGQ